jgi:signal peptidase I
VKHRRLRVAVATGLFVALAGVTWIYFAPVGIGGGTAYVVTHGVSMEPRFHTGDLAIVRAASTYRVGQIVAYHSSLLHEVVLHRIVAIHGGRYVFKGDNNSFFDPVHPTQSDLIGRLWIHVPRVGLVLDDFRTPLGAAIVAAVIGLLMFGFVRADAKDGRSRIPGKTNQAETRTMKPADSESSLATGLRDGLIAAGVAVVVFAALCLFAFDRPYRVAGTRAVPYSQRAVFTYSAHVQPDAVYPSGKLVTGGPIFLNFVDTLNVGLHYRLLTPGAAHVAGTSTVALRLTGPTGWSRTFPLVGKRAFTHGEFRSTAVLNLTSVKNLLSQVQTLTGVTGSSSTVTVVATVHLAGHVSGSRVRTTFSPLLSFQLGATQLQPQGPSGNLTSPRRGFVDTRHATVTVASSRANPLHLFGHALGVNLLRLLAAVGLLVSVLTALVLGIMLQRLRRLAEPEQIQAQYRHVIVPIADDAGFSGQEPVDLDSMEALVRLSEHYGRLILHSRRNGADSYLLDDGAVIYRYRAGKTVSAQRGPASDDVAVTASQSVLPGRVGGVRASPSVAAAGSAAKASPSVAPPSPAVKPSPSAAAAVAPASPPALSVKEAAAAFAAAVLAESSPAAAADEPPTSLSSDAVSAKPSAPVFPESAVSEPPLLVFAERVAAEPPAPVFPSAPVFPAGVAAEPPWLAFADGMPADPRADSNGVTPEPSERMRAHRSSDRAPSTAPATAAAARAAGRPTVVPPEIDEARVSVARLRQMPVVPEASTWVPPTPPGFPPQVPPAPARLRPASLGAPPEVQVSHRAPISGAQLPVSGGQTPAARVDALSPAEEVLREPSLADVGSLAARVLMDSARKWRKKRLA